MFFMLFVIMLNGKSRIEIINGFARSCARKLEVSNRGSKTFLFETIAERPSACNEGNCEVGPVELYPLTNEIKCRRVPAHKQTITVEESWELVDEKSSKPPQTENP